MNIHKYAHASIQHKIVYKHIIYQSKLGMIFTSGNYAMHVV